MALIGTKSLQVILQGVIIRTPIIAKVYAYPRRDEQNHLHLAVHIISDGGTSDTVIKKLCDRVKADFAKAYEHECVHGLEKFKFVHSDARSQIPERSQLIYVRPAVA